MHTQLGWRIILGVVVPFWTLAVLAALALARCL